MKKNYSLFFLTLLNNDHWIMGAHLCLAKLGFSMQQKISLFIHQMIQFDLLKECMVLVNHLQAANKCFARCAKICLIWPSNQSDAMHNAHLPCDCFDVNSKLSMNDTLLSLIHAQKHHAAKKLFAPYGHFARNVSFLEKSKATKVVYASMAIFKMGNALTSASSLLSLNFPLFSALRYFPSAFMDMCKH